MARARSWNLRKLIPRAIVFLLLFLSAGAIVNAAVAWPLSARGHSRVQHQELPIVQNDINWWCAHAPSHLADADLGAYEWIRFGRHTVMYYDKRSVSEGKGPLVNCFRSMHGWPMVSLEHATWVDRQAASGSRVWANGLIALPQRWPLPRDRPVKLPTQPLWPGFAINTIFYAAILWLLLAALGMLRRRWRRKRGGCPACGYRIAPGTGEVCSECGAAVARRPRSSDFQDSSSVIPAPVCARASSGIQENAGLATDRLDSRLRGNDEP